MSTEEFSPQNHGNDKPIYFEGLGIGDAFPIPSRTVTEAHFAAFQTVSGDNHPIHYDLEYCKARGHPGLFAHGLQVLCTTAAGAGRLPHVLGESLIAFIEESCKFLKPVYVGDTLYPNLVVTELKEQRTTGVATLRATVHNQRGELCLEGEQKYLIRKRPQAD